MKTKQNVLGSVLVVLIGGMLVLGWIWTGLGWIIGNVQEGQQYNQCTPGDPGCDEPQGPPQQQSNNPNPCTPGDPGCEPGG